MLCEGVGFPSPRAGRRGLAVLALALLAAAPEQAAAAPARANRADGLRIRRVVIKVYDVFDPPSNIFFKAANALHYQTRAEVVRRELLLKEGDRFDLRLMRESERNLRRLSFIRDARVRYVRTKNNEIVLIARVYDAWTLEANPGYKRAGSQNFISVTAAENNLLGTGKAVGFGYQAKPGLRRSFNYRDQQFMNSRKTLALDASYTASSRQFSAFVAKPFSASITPRSWEIATTISESDEANYDGGREAGVVRRERTSARLLYGISIGTDTRRERRISAGWETVGARFRELGARTTGPIPQPETLLLLNVRGTYRMVDFIKRRRQDKLSRVEDINVGWNLETDFRMAPGRKRGLLGDQTQFLPNALLSVGESWNENLLFGRLRYDARHIHGKLAERIAQAELLFYNQDLPRQTIAARVWYSHALRLAPGGGLGLGEENGLRGYGLGEFTGNRRLVFNVEDRLFIASDVLRLVDLGLVAFFDTGLAWTPGEDGPRNPFSAVGVGLRIAPSRSRSNDPVRVDFAYGLNDRGRASRWSVSIQAGQAFSL